MATDYYDQLENESKVERAEYNLVALLGLHPYPDGDQWCVLWGEDLQSGVAGFGSTPHKAVLDFIRNLHRESKLTEEANSMTSSSKTSIESVNGVECNEVAMAITDGGE